MKFIEFLHNSNPCDIIRIDHYSSFINSLISNTSCHILPISEDYLENNNISDILLKFRDSIILISSGDIDFPPPKKPYSYSKYFDKLKMPIDYDKINYYSKIHMDILPILDTNNLYIVSHDVSVSNARILNMPLGAYSKFNHVHLKTSEKTQLCYANFSIPWNPFWFGDIRLQIFNIIKDKPFITLDNIKYSNDRLTDNIDQFYKNISISKFAICPRGCGIDTYRLWDCLYLGCIPIVEKYDGHKEFDDLPIFFIDSVDSYNTLTSEFLELKYIDMLNTVYNFSKLDFSYWKNKINLLCNKLVKE
jgi:hypothetical protein